MKKMAEYAIAMN